MAADLPSEVLSQIFTLAADEDLIFQHTLPTSLANSSWFRHVNGDWALRTPHEAANYLMRRSYRTKKAVLLTCKHWYEVGYELLFRCLFFNSPSKLLDLCKILQSSNANASTITSSVGWWTRRLHVCRYSTREFEQLGITNDDMRDAFVTIVSHCPNLEIFHVDWPMKEAFGPVADALMTYSKRSVRTVSWNIPLRHLAKVIWALDSLKRVEVVHIEIEASESKDTSEEEEGFVNLGSAYELQLTLGHLRQLSLRSYTQALLEQATGWVMPALRMFSIDSGISKGHPPDVEGFLAQHGEGLEFLDLDTTFPLDVAKILDYCPQLQTFAFNGDWRIIPNNDIESEIVRRPRPTITTVGLHGLSHAFGVGLAAQTANLTHSRIIQRSNDMNMMALNRKNFPKLQRIRALNRGMLADLNAAGQPSQDLGGMERWERWWDRCTASRIRLEDCTGDALGNLPDVEDPVWVVNEEEDVEASGSDEDGEDEEGDEDSEEEEEETDDDDDQGFSFSVPPLPSDNPSSTTAELRQLLEECRIMGQQREESMLSPMLAMMGGGMIGGPSMGFGDPSLALSAFQQHYGTTFDD